MEANLDGLGYVLENLDAPGRIAATIDELSLAVTPVACHAPATGFQ
jgi:hypothetical protein